MDQVILPNQQQQQQQSSKETSKNASAKEESTETLETAADKLRRQDPLSSVAGVTVVSQGGLAPVALQLAARNNPSSSGRRSVHSLILASPPAADEILSAVPAEERQRNYEFLTGPWGQRAFQYLLETGKRRAPLFQSVLV